MGQLIVVDIDPVHLSCNWRQCIATVIVPTLTLDFDLQPPARCGHDVHCCKSAMSEVGRVERKMRKPIPNPNLQSPASHGHNLHSHASSMSKVSGLKKEWKQMDR